MSDWRTIAAQVLSKDERKPTPPPAEPALADLPSDLRQQLDRLPHLPVPDRLRERDLWTGIVADCLALAKDGWVTRALGLGWKVSDIYGVGADDTFDFMGLAVWLAGRRLVLLDHKMAIAADGAARPCFNRPSLRIPSPDVAIVPIWRFGRPSR